MKDVAQEAGVSIGTVSKVFNGLPVGKKYRDKVRRAANKLGYQVNLYARGMRTNKTSTVALIVPEIEQPFCSALARHVCAALTLREYRMLLYTTGFQPEMELDCINRARQNMVDGIIVLTHTPLRVDTGLPIVSVDHCLSPNIPCITSENYGGGYMAAEKLIKLGCRRLAYLRTASPNFIESDEQGNGFKMVCHTMKIPYDTLLLDDIRDTESLRSFFNAHMSDRALDMDGIFCSTNLLVWQIHSVLKELNIRIPEDVQVIGSDVSSRLGGEGFFCSTIVQPVDKIADTSVRLVLTEDRANIPARICLPVSYTPGWTTRERIKEGARGQ
ncbi:MAG: substrate-binding domain-containing protein [Oscillospiraceae bacterium]|nr:substrate-binding domain-containing protein [Oscillospiraceae bacterium]